METRLSPDAVVPRHQDWLRWELILLGLGALGNPLHESGHWMVWTLRGIPATMTFGQTRPLLDSGPGDFLVNAGGPFVNLALAWIGVYLQYRSIPLLAQLGTGLTLVMAYGRLLVYLTVVLFGMSISRQDEGRMAHYLGWPMWSWVWVLGGLFLLTLVLTWRRTAGPAWQRGSIFLGALVVYGAVAGFEVLVLDTLLFDARGP